MYLKSIELIGFKSFASKMAFKFEEGMTAIVGPNGSGKSNVADAVRWVLGEQSAKQLRGSKMEDVIFSGTETRKPHGYCQVDLTIDNQDMKMPIEYSEVTVSRRVYRSGEGEYFINGTSCRLRDVHELFMDTGVGKEGYSIIGQGQIDKILSTKPDDRRALFDEAAGIVKFKNRKTSAEKSLDKERQNLLRINDIIVELEGQKEILKEQSATAKQYLEKKESLKKFELNIFVQETQRITEQIEQIEHKEKHVEGHIKEASESHEENKRKHLELNKELETMETAIESSRVVISDLKSEKERKESAIALVKEQMAHLSSNHMRALDRIKTIKDKKESASAELEALEGQLASLAEEALKDSEALTLGNGKLEAVNTTMSDLECAMNTLQSDMIEQLNSMSNDKSRINRLEADLEHKSSRKEAIVRQVTRLNQQMDEEKDTVERLAAALEQKKASLDALGEKESKAKEKTGELTLLIGEFEEKIKDCNYRKHSEESKASAIATVEEEYEGYQYSIKQVMLLRKKEGSLSEGIHGVVADVIRTDKQYEKAIETALGSAHQNIITDNETTAKELIGYLKKNRFGRATFLPLTTIKGRTPRKRVDAGYKGFIGYANELVETESRYEAIMSHLLGNIVIADNLDNGMAIASKEQFGVRIVTLDGDVINPGGAMTGGAYKNDRNQFLSRKRELEEHLAKASELAREIGSLEQKLAASKNELAQLSAEMKSVAEELQIKKEDFHKESMRLEQLAANLVKLQGEKTDQEEELALIDSALVGHQSELDETKGKLNHYDHNKESSEKRIEEISLKLLELKEEKEQLLEELTGLRVRSSASNEKKRHAEALIDRMKEEANGIADEMATLKRELTDGESSYEEKEKRIEEITQEISDLTGKIESLETKQSESISARQQKQKIQESLYEQREEESARISQLEKDLSRLENQKVKLDVQKENLLDYMWNEYEMTYNQAHKYLDESLGTLSAVKQKISTLKSEIKELGDVNVNAIEDYKQVSERYDFLTTQRDDVVKAEEKLMQIIGDLDVSMQEQFRERFREINREFGFMFKELFGGGKAMLELTDTDNVLESGVQIIAQPPGKKLQNMMLLSGGERAFTAIALLFAIQSLKPSPFCVLDEIDAALDDANVERFAKYLLKLAGNTQFIIITHKQGTMAAAHALYGITMQEKGVSTQVSVKLIEDELER